MERERSPCAPALRLNRLDESLFPRFRQVVLEIHHPGTGLYGLTEDEKLGVSDVRHAKWRQTLCNGKCHCARCDLPFDSATIPVARQVLAKLARHMVLVHVHGNNFGGVELIRGVPVPVALELTYVRSGEGTAGGARGTE